MTAGDSGWMCSVPNAETPSDTCEASAPHLVRQRDTAFDPTSIVSVASDVRACDVSSSLRLLLNAPVLWRLGPSLNYEALEDLGRVFAPSSPGDTADKSSTAPDRQAQGLS